MVFLYQINLGDGFTRKIVVEVGQLANGVLVILRHGVEVATIATNMGC